MQFQLSSISDPEGVLQRVWQRDYPPTWHVFSGPRNSLAVVLLITVQVIIGLVAILFLCAGVLAAITAFTEKPGGDAVGVVLLVGIIMLVPIGLIILLQRGVRAARNRASNKPGSTMVILPEGVVAYHRKETRAISFAHIVQMQLRVQARTQTNTTYTTSTDANGITSMVPHMTTVPAAPSIWLDLTFDDNQRGVWRIDIAPQDTIAQSIIEAYIRYRARSGS